MFSQFEAKIFIPSHLFVYPIFYSCSLICWVIMISLILQCSVTSLRFTPIWRVLESELSMALPASCLDFSIHLVSTSTLCYRRKFRLNQVNPEKDELSTSSNNEETMFKAWVVNTSLCCTNLKRDQNSCSDELICTELFAMSIWKSEYQFHRLLIDFYPLRRICFGYQC